MAIECIEKRLNNSNINLTILSGALRPARSRDETTPKDMELCWAHLMPIGDTGRGPITVLGMPFLRTFYTAYNMKDKKIGDALAHTSPSEGI